MNSAKTLKHFLTLDFQVSFIFSLLLHACIYTTVITHKNAGGSCFGMEGVGRVKNRFLWDFDPRILCISFLSLNHKINVHVQRWKFGTFDVCDESDDDILWEIYHYFCIFFFNLCLCMVFTSFCVQFISGFFLKN